MSVFLPQFFSWCYSFSSECPSHHLCLWNSYSSFMTQISCHFSPWSQSCGSLSLQPDVCSLLSGPQTLTFIFLKIFIKSVLGYRYLQTCLLFSTSIKFLESRSSVFYIPVMSTEPTGSLLPGIHNILWKPGLFIGYAIPLVQSLEDVVGNWNMEHK